MLVSFAKPTGESGMTDPLFTADLVVIDGACKVLFRYATDLGPTDAAKFFVEDKIVGKDVTNDGVPELLFKTGTVGASDYWAVEHVIYRVLGTDDFRDIRPQNWASSWRQPKRWILVNNEIVGAVAQPIDPADSDDPHMCHSCPKFYQYLAYKWDKNRKAFLLIKSMQSAVDFDGDTDPLDADMARIQKALASETQ